MDRARFPSARKKRALPWLAALRRLAASSDNYCEHAKALEKLTGTPVGGLLPIPDVSNKKFPDAMALEAQGLHTIMWKWCPSDTYTQVGEI